MNAAGLAAAGGGVKNFAVGVAVILATVAVVYVGYKAYKTGKWVTDKVGAVTDAAKAAYANVERNLKQAGTALSDTEGFNRALMGPPPTAAPADDDKTLNDVALEYQQPWYLGGGLSGKEVISPDGHRVY